MEMEIYPGKCECGRKLNMMIAPLDDDNKEIIGWMIYGTCKKCNEVLVIDTLKDIEKPVLDRDYTIDWDKKVDTKKGDKLEV